MAIKDYEQKNGTAPAEAKAVTNEDGSVSIELKDENGNILDTYVIDPETGVGTGSDGEEVNLPQTGISSVRTAAAASTALALTVAGLFAIMKSGVLTKKEEEA